MGLAVPGVADGQDVLSPGDELAPGQFQGQDFIQRRNGRKVKGVEALDDREGGRLDPPLGGSLIPVNQLQFRKPE